MNIKSGTCVAYLVATAAFGIDNVWAMSAIQDEVCMAPGHVDMKNKGRMDAWIVKVDNGMDTLWEKVIGGKKDEYMLDAVNIPDGGCIFVGTKDISRDRFRDFWLIKTDKYGDIQWSKTYGGDGDDIAYVAKMIDKDIVVAGVTYPRGRKTTEAWLARIDSDGSIVWSKNINTYENNFAYDLTVTKDKKLLVAGINDAQKKNWWDAWVLKLDLEGNVIWDKFYGGDRTDSAYSIVETYNHNYLVAGSTDSKGNGQLDAWVFEIDAQGEMQEEWLFGGSRNDAALSIITTQPNSYWFAGYTESEGKGRQDGWVVSVDTRKDYKTAATYGGTGDDYIYKLMPINNNRLLTQGGTTPEGESHFSAWLNIIDDSNALIDEKIFK